VNKTDLPRSKQALDTPALLVDLDKLGHNIARMREIVAGSGLVLRPHAKSSKCAEVARMQIEAGARGICCAKLGEAEAMVEAGIDDILITTPIAGEPKVSRLAALARRARIAVVADSADAIRAIDAAAAVGKSRVAVVVEVNVGQDRCGVEPGPVAAELAGVVSQLKNVDFAGLQGYHGRLQGIVSYAERRHEVRLALDRLLLSAAAVRAAGHEVRVLTGGGTGSAPIDLDFHGLTELQPGSYIYMDTSYRRIEWDVNASPIPFEQSLSILSSVVSRPVAQRAVVDVGWKSASVDSGAPTVRNLEGVAFEFAGDEHGTLRGIEATQLRPGDRVELVPSHCDTTVNLYDRIIGCRGEEVVTVWEIGGRGRSQ
jgi:D-serine deaminase-like pyridoxal phosphate-dependent protein